VGRGFSRDVPEHEKQGLQPLTYDRVLSECSFCGCFFPGQERTDALLFWCGVHVGAGFLYRRSQIVFGNDVIAVKDRAFGSMRGALRT
jgi:hypothetical protein